jgi:all-trans-8'-apo-beta-carotenal 15,15'-oxygenase
LGADVAPPQGIAKLDIDTRQTEVWIPKEYEFCGEPMFASRENASPEEDDGYILSVLYNGKSKESELIILRADAVAVGPITRLPLGMRVPHGMYGCFTNAEEANWSADEIERRAKLADKMESRGNNWNEVKSDFSGLGLRLDDFEEYFGDIL